MGKIISFEVPLRYLIRSSTNCHEKRSLPVLSLASCVMVAVDWPHSGSSLNKNKEGWG